jgi:hypothetical protein
MSWAEFADLPDGIPRRLRKQYLPAALAAIRALSDAPPADPVALMPTIERAAQGGRVMPPFTLAKSQSEADRIDSDLYRIILAIEHAVERESKPRKTAWRDALQAVRRARLNIRQLMDAKRRQEPSS